MRILIVSDIHSNLEAFQSVIDDARERGGFDQIWQMGDLVGYGPDPVECIDLLRKHDVLGVTGNHDLAAIGKLSLEAFNAYAAAALRWNASQLAQEHKDYLAGLLLQIEMDGFTAVHGSPRDPVWEYVVSPAAAVASFSNFDTPKCLVGHSHLPFLCRPSDDSAVFLEFPLDSPVKLGNDRMIINPGGVGQPRDGDPRASYAIYDSQSGSAFHYRAEYDIAKTQEKMSDRGLPKYLADRLAVGR